MGKLRNILEAFLSANFIEKENGRLEVPKQAYEDLKYGLKEMGFDPIEKNFHPDHNYWVYPAANMFEQIQVLEDGTIEMAADIIKGIEIIMQWAGKDERN